MVSVGFEDSAGGGSRSSTVAWAHVNSYRCSNLCDARVEGNLPRDIYVPMLKSLPGVQDHSCGQWRPLLTKLLLSWASVVTET